MNPPNDKLRHDFKNHLGIILGFVDLLLEDVSPDDPKRGDLEQIQRAAHAALDLLNRMLPPAHPAP
jgi:signal transduction histidine kinase